MDLDSDYHSETSFLRENLSEDDGKSNKRKAENCLYPAKKLKTGKLKQKTQNKKKQLYKPPTAEELNNLRETENLYNSNLFRFQIDGLLDEIKIKPKYLTLYNEWYNQFANFIIGIPEYDGIKLSEIVNKNDKKSKLQKFKNLLVKHHKGIFKTDQDLNFKFLKPEEYNVLALHEINLSVGPQLRVNINVTMPKACFLEKDYLNNRYFVKRDYYLTYLFIQLRKSKSFSKLDYVSENVIEAIPNTCPNIFIQFHVTASSSCFKLNRFEPNKNNIRADVFKYFNEINLDELKQHGTCLYNSAMLYDLTLKSNYEYIKQHLKDYTNLQDGIRLLRVWLMQRDLCWSKGGFSHQLLLNLVIYMAQKRKINEHMSSYQIIRNVWVFLSTSNWNESPISICESLSSNSLQKFKDSYDVVFVDNTGYYNIASFLNVEVYFKIRSEAKLAVQYLDEVNFDTFGALFLTKMGPEFQYDALLRLTDPTHYNKVYKITKPVDRYKYIGFYKQLITKNIVDVFKKRLNKRLLNIVPLLSEADDASTNLQAIELNFGITLNAECAFSVIEKGPPSNSEDAFTFLQFWGSLSQCRRFADGTICEAVYFKSNTAQEKRKIFRQIIDFIIRDKFEIKDYNIFGDQFEEVLLLKTLTAPFQTGTNEEATLKLITIFDELDAKIRELKLPLEISDLRGTSEVFCFTKTFPPIPSVYKQDKQLMQLQENSFIFKEVNKETVPQYVEPIECVIQLGINSKWPKEIEKLRDVKTIYYLEISKLLTQSKILSRANPEYLEVFYKGLLFRFRVYHSKEVALLKKYNKPDGTIAYKDTEESLSLEKNLRILPKIIGALRGLQAQNNCYGVSTTLIKRWLRSQLIDEYHIPDIVISLLNAHLFIRSAPFDRANLPQVAFLRFLKFVSTLDYINQFIVVNFNNELSKEDINNIQLSFEQNRAGYPLLHIVTPFDEEKCWFTKPCYKEVVNRMKCLAYETLVLLQNKIIKDMDFFTIQKLFTPNMEGYNVKIELKPHLNPLHYQNINFTDNVLSKVRLQEFMQEEQSSIPVIDFILAKKYLHDLRASYGNLALFFYDCYGGNVIGVLWKPSALEKKPFKVSHIENGLELKDKELVLNTAVIVEDFYVLGKGLVKHIKLQE